MTHEKIRIGSQLKMIRKLSSASVSEKKFGATSNYVPAYERVMFDSDLVLKPQLFHYDFAKTETDLCLEDAGLHRLYVLFGASGMGKSHLLLKLLHQLAASNTSQPWGGVLLDPKRSLISDVVKDATEPRMKDRIKIIGPSNDGSQTVNILASHLSPRDLGVALALAAQAAGIAGGDPYWINEMKRIFGAGLMLLKLGNQPLTLAKIAELLIKYVYEETGTQKKLELEIKRANSKDFRSKLSNDDQRRLDHALSDLAEFSQAKGENADTVRSFLHQALSPFLDPDLDYVSDEKSKDSIADLVFRDGKWILLDVPRASLASARMLTTLVKILFQRGALERDELYPKNKDRNVFLIADEYAEIASDLPGEGFGDSIFFSQMRSARVLSFIATQGAPMLQNSGVKETWKTILTNAGGKLFFRIDDPDTAELAASLAGEGDVVVVDYGIGHGQGAANFNQGRKLERRSILSTDIFLTALERGQLVFIGSTDGKSRSNVRYAKVDE